MPERKVERREDRLMQVDPSIGETNILGDIKKYAVEDNSLVRFARSFTYEDRRTDVGISEKKEFGETLETQLRRFRDESITPDSSDLLKEHAQLEARRSAAADKYNKVDPTLLADKKRDFEDAVSNLRGRNLNVEALERELATRRADEINILPDRLRFTLLRGSTSSLRDSNVLRDTNTVLEYRILMERVKLEGYWESLKLHDSKATIRRAEKTEGRLEGKKEYSHKIDSKLWFLDQELKDPNKQKEALDFKLKLYDDARQYYLARSIREEALREKPLEDLDTEVGGLKKEQERLSLRGDQAAADAVDEKINELEKGRAAKEALASFNIETDNVSNVFSLMNGLLPSIDVDAYKTMVAEHQAHEKEGKAEVKLLDDKITAAHGAVKAFDRQGRVKSRSEEPTIESQPGLDWYEHRLPPYYTPDSSILSLRQLPEYYQGPRPRALDKRIAAIEKRQEKQGIDRHIVAVVGTLGSLPEHDRWIATRAQEGLNRGKFKGDKSLSEDTINEYRNEPKVDRLIGVYREAALKGWSLSDLKRVSNIFDRSSRNKAREVIRFDTREMGLRIAREAYRLDLYDVERKVEEQKSDYAKEAQDIDRKIGILKEARSNVKGRYASDMDADVPGFKRVREAHEEQQLREIEAAQAYLEQRKAELHSTLLKEQIYEKRLQIQISELNDLMKSQKDKGKEAWGDKASLERQIDTYNKDVVRDDKNHREAGVIIDRYVNPDEKISFTPDEYIERGVQRAEEVMSSKKLKDVKPRIEENEKALNELQSKKGTENTPEFIEKTTDLLLSLQKLRRTSIELQMVGRDDNTRFHYGNDVWTLRDDQRKEIEGKIGSHNERIAAISSLGVPNTRLGDELAAREEAVSELKIGLKQLEVEQSEAAEWQIPLYPRQIALKTEARDRAGTVYERAAREAELKELNDDLDRDLTAEVKKGRRRAELRGLLEAQLKKYDAKMKDKRESAGRTKEEQDKLDSKRKGLNERIGELLELRIERFGVDNLSTLRNFTQENAVLDKFLSSAVDRGTNKQKLVDLFGSLTGREKLSLLDFDIRKRETEVDIAEIEARQGKKDAEPRLRVLREELHRLLTGEQEYRIVIAQQAEERRKGYIELDRLIDTRVKARAQEDINAINKTLSGKEDATARRERAEKWREEPDGEGRRLSQLREAMGMEEELERLQELAGLQKRIEENKKERDALPSGEGTENDPVLIEKDTDLLLSLQRLERGSKGLEIGLAELPNAELAERTELQRLHSRQLTEIETRALSHEAGIKKIEASVAVTATITPRLRTELNARKEALSELKIGLTQLELERALADTRSVARNREDRLRGTLLKLLDDRLKEHNDKKIVRDTREARDKLDAKRKELSERIGEVLGKEISKHINNSAVANIRDYSKVDEALANALNQLGVTKNQIRDDLRDVVGKNDVKPKIELLDLEIRKKEAEVNAAEIEARLKSQIEPEQQIQLKVKQEELRSLKIRAQEYKLFAASNAEERGEQYVRLDALVDVQVQEQARRQIDSLTSKLSGASNEDRAELEKQIEKWQQLEKTWREQPDGMGLRLAQIREGMGIGDELKHFLELNSVKQHIGENAKARSALPSGEGAQNNPAFIEIDTYLLLSLQRLERDRNRLQTELAEFPNTKDQFRLELSGLQDVQRLEIARRIQDHDARITAINSSGALKISSRAELAARKEALSELRIDQKQLELELAADVDKDLRREELLELLDARLKEHDDKKMAGDTSAAQEARATLDAKRKELNERIGKLLKDHIDEHFGDGSAIKDVRDFSETDTLLDDFLKDPDATKDQIRAGIRDLLGSDVVQQKRSLLDLDIRKKEADVNAAKIEARQKNQAESELLLQRQEELRLMKIKAQGYKLFTANDAEERGEQYVKLDELMDMQVKAQATEQISIIDTRLRGELSEAEQATLQGHKVGWRKLAETWREQPGGMGPQLVRIREGMGIGEELKQFRELKDVNQRIRDNEEARNALRSGEEDQNNPAFIEKDTDLLLSGQRLERDSSRLRLVLAAPGDQPDRRAALAKLRSDQQTEIARRIEDHDTRITAINSSREWDDDKSKAELAARKEARSELVIGQKQLELELTTNAGGVRDQRRGELLALLDARLKEYNDKKIAGNTSEEPAKLDAKRKELNERIGKLLEVSIDEHLWAYRLIQNMRNLDSLYQELAGILEESDENIRDTKRTALKAALANRGGKAKIELLDLDIRKKEAAANVAEIEARQKSQTEPELQVQLQEEQKQIRLLKKHAQEYKIVDASDAKERGEQYDKLSKLTDEHITVINAEVFALAGDSPEIESRRAELQKEASQWRLDLAYCKKEVLSVEGKEQTTNLGRAENKLAQLRVDKDISEGELRTWQREKASDRTVDRDGSEEQRKKSLISDMQGEIDAAEIDAAKLRKTDIEAQIQNCESRIAVKLHEFGEDRGKSLFSPGGWKSRPEEKEEHNAKWMQEVLPLRVELTRLEIQHLNQEITIAALGPIEGRGAVKDLRDARKDLYGGYYADKKMAVEREQQVVQSELAEASKPLQDERSQIEGLLKSKQTQKEMHEKGVSEDALRAFLNLERNRLERDIFKLQRDYKKREADYLEDAHKDPFFDAELSKSEEANGFMEFVKKSKDDVDGQKKQKDEGVKLLEILRAELEQAYKNKKANNRIRLKLEMNFMGNVHPAGNIDDVLDDWLSEKRRVLQKK